MGKKTKRAELTVRQLVDSDAWVYKQIAWGEAVSTFCSFFLAETIDDARKKIAENNRNHQRLYGLFNKSNRLLAAFLVSDDVTTPSAVVHYFVGERYRGNGYAVSGIYLLSELLFFEYERFSFEVRNNNAASIRVMEKIEAEMTRESKTMKYFVYQL